MSEEGITRWVVFMGQYVRRGYNISEDGLTRWVVFMGQYV